MTRHKKRHSKGNGAVTNVLVDIAGYRIYEYSHDNEHTTYLSYKDNCVFKRVVLPSNYITEMPGRTSEFAAWCAGKLSAARKVVNNPNYYETSISKHQIIGCT